MACYDQIIGLARADCPCLSVDPPDEFNESQSGLYITDLVPLEILGDLAACGEGSVWDQLAKSLEDATNTFIADTNALMMSHFGFRREKFKGQIGEATGREFLTTDKQYAGIQIAANPMRGGQIKITQIGTLFSGAGTITYWIYNALNVQVATGTLTVANGWHLNTLTTPIELPTYTEFSNKHEYHLVYEYDADNKPRRNKINCGCGGFVPWFDWNRPMWANPHSGSRAWANWIMVGGWTGDTLTDFDESQTSTTTEMNGLALQIELGCDIGQVLCNGSLDFGQDAFALSIAYAIRYKAASLMITKILGSVELKRANTINREYWKEKRVEWESGILDDSGARSGGYNQNVEFISQQASLSGNDCLVCSDPYGMQVKTVMT